MAHVLFVCLHNAGRSQISQALFERAAGGPHTADSAGTTAHTADSAGTAPAERVHPEVVEVMREIGIDLSDRHPKRLTRQLAEAADLVITMGCGDQCPYIPGRRYLDWGLPDPRGRPLQEIRAIRDEIAERVHQLLAELDSNR
jgi:arsenate reductase